jgi:hypothetical protein
MSMRLFEEDIRSTPPSEEGLYIEELFAAPNYAEMVLRKIYDAIPQSERLAIEQAMSADTALNPELRQYYWREHLLDRYVQNLRHDAS